MARSLQYVEVVHEQNRLLVATSHLESPLPSRSNEEVRSLQLAQGRGSESRGQLLRQVLRSSVIKDS